MKQECIDAGHTPVEVRSEGRRSFVGCKDCRRASDRRFRSSEHGRERLKIYKARKRSSYSRSSSIRSGRRRLAAFRQWLWSLKDAPCFDCWGTFDPVCMDFDHRPGTIKSFGIGSSGFKKTREEVLAEIAKCDIVCANCHRLRSYRERDHGALVRVHNV